MDQLDQWPLYGPHLQSRREGEHRCEEDKIRGLLVDKIQEAWSHFEENCGYDYHSPGGLPGLTNADPRTVALEVIDDPRHH